MVSQEIRGVVDREDRVCSARHAGQSVRCANQSAGSVSRILRRMAEVRIPIPDRTGAAAELFMLAAELGVNIANFEVVHMAESNRGVAVVLVDAAATDLFRGGLDCAWVQACRDAARLMATRWRCRPLDRPVDAIVAVPGSKSIANRALVCAAEAPGTSELTNVPDGDDTTAMLVGLTALGAIIVADAGRGPAGGIPDPRRIGNADVHAACGTTSRFLTVLAALGHDPVTIDGLPPCGDARSGRSMTVSVQLGVRVTPGESWGHLPVTIQGPPDAGAVSIAGDVSSEHITALMLIGLVAP